MICSKCGGERTGKSSWCNPCKASHERAKRASDPEKYLLLSREQYKKHGAKANAKRAEKYHSNPEYRKWRLEKDRAYTKTGRRNELYHLHAESNRQRSSAYKKRNSDAEKIRQAKYRETAKEVIAFKRHHSITSLCDNYLKVVIKKQCKYLIKSNDIPPDIIKTKRLSIQIKRQIQ